MSSANYLTITGFSTALFSTWYFVDEIDCLFDCGDGVSAGLLQKGRKVKHIFISHADRDHLAGLLQFNQLNARPKLSVYFPRDCGSFPVLAEFSARFDSQVGGTRWVPIGPGDEVWLRCDLVVRAVENRHVATVGGEVKSLSYFVEAVSKKLRPEFLGKSGREISRLRKELGEDAVLYESRKKKLVYSGDTPIETDGRYDDAEVLIHEATFLSFDGIDPTDSPRLRHSSLDQVMQMVADSGVETLVLGHFSSRYDEPEIVRAVQIARERYQVKIPIKLVLPGKIARDVLVEPGPDD